MIHVPMPLTNPPAVLYDWLNYKFSLMDKLQEKVGETSLSVLNQRWQRPTWWDQFVLGIKEAQVIHRNSIISAKDLACWFARTIIPNSCYLANKSFFDRLSQESLGKLVFNTVGLKRSEVFFYPINASCLEYYWLPPALKEATKSLWLRLSVFCFNEKENFYLVEIFLPGFVRILH